MDQVSRADEAEDMVLHIDELCHPLGVYQPSLKNPFVVGRFSSVIEQRPAYLIAHLRPRYLPFREQTAWRSAVTDIFAGLFKGSQIGSCLA